jgi:hypothetical protein
LRMRDTVLCATPAAAATSFIVTGLRVSVTSGRGCRSSRADERLKEPCDLF